MKRNFGKKVLMVSSYANGGIASVVDLLINSRLKDDLIFLPSYIEASTLKNWLRFIFFYFKYIFVLLKEKEIRIVHLLSAEKGSFLRKSILLLTAKILGKKAIINFHSCNPNLFYKDDIFPLSFFVNSILNKANLILVLSAQWQRILSNKCNNSNIKILYNPVVLKEPIQRNSECVNILFMGRLGKRKGAYDLIEMAKYLTSNNVKINMYGDGEVKQIIHLVNENNLNNIINVAGWIKGDEVKEAYRNADIFILPSYDEGLPMSILEAMAYSLPVISTPIGGIPDQVIDGVNGFLVSPGDIKKFAEKIDFLVSNKNEREKMRQESYKIAREKFDINSIITQLENLYSCLI